MQGKCYYCGKELNERTIKRHMKSCLEMQSVINEEMAQKRSRTRNQFILSLKDKYNKKRYCMYLFISGELQVVHLDKFIRDVWVECCSHLSSFTIDNNRYNDNSDGMYAMNVFLKDVLREGLKFDYEYDFGSTTYIELEVIDEIKVSTKHSMIEIIARNNEIVHKCSRCGKNAQYLSYSKKEFLCKDCAKGYSDYDFNNMCIEEIGNEYYNSPRDGVCGYCGDRDAEIRYMPRNNNKYKKDLHKPKVGIKEYDMFEENNIMLPMNNVRINDIEDMFRAVLAGNISDYNDENIEEKMKQIFNNHLAKSMDRFLSDIERVFYKGKYSFDLKELVSSMNKNAIEIILINNYIDVKSGMKKSSLIEKTLNEYEDIMYRIVDNFETDKLNILQRCVRNNGIIKDGNEDFDKCMYFLNRAVLFPSMLDNKPIFIMPEKMQEIVRKYDDIEIIRKARKNQQIINLFKGMIRAYGVLDFADSYNIISTYVDNIDKEHLSKILREGSVYDPHFYFVDDVNENVFFINEDIEDYEAILQKMDANIEFKKFTKEELIEMSEYDYLQKSKYGAKFLRDFSNLMEIDDDDCIEAMKVMSIDIQERDVTDIHRDILRGMFFEDSSELIKIVNELVKNIPLWKLKGASLYDMEKEERQSADTKKGKHIGRNDKCSCGSRKKHNACCGRKNNVIKLN